jgi:hypothetical protein
MKIKVIDNFLVILLSFLILIVVSILFWSIDKGFDLADEGLHYAFSINNTVNNNSLFNYNLFFKLFYKITNFEFSIVTLRIFKISLLILLFIFGLLFFNKNQFSTFDKLFLFLGMFSCYTIFTQSLSYNTLSFSLVLVYIYIYALINKASFYKQISLFFLLSILSSLSFFIKSPLSFVLLGITFILALFTGQNKKLNIILIRFLFILIGFVIIQLSFQLLFDNYSFIRVFKDSLQLSTYYESYNKTILIKRVIAAFKWVLILGLVGWIFASLSTKINLKTYKTYVSVFFIIIFLFYFYYSHLSSNEFDILQYGLMIVASLGIGFFIFYFNNKFTFQDISIIILLFIAPFVCSFGSNVYFFRTGQHYLFFWLLLFVYLKSLGTSMPKVIYNFFILFFSFFIVFKIYDNVISSPHNQPKLDSNFVTYNYGNNNQIELDKKQSNYLIELQNKMKKWSPNRKEIIGLYAMPGDILLTGYTNYYTPLIWDTFQWNFIKDKISINPEYNKKPPSIFLVKSIDDGIKNSLQGFSIVDSLKHYDGNYVYIFSKESTFSNK